MADQSKNPTQSRVNFISKRLTRLFSGPITNYRSQMTRDYKRHTTGLISPLVLKVRAVNNSSAAGYNPFAQINPRRRWSNQRRTESYTDFDQMEYTPEIASAL